MLRIELPGKTKRGTPKGRFVYAVREDMAVVEVTQEEDAVKTEWRWKSPVATLDRSVFVTANLWNDPLGWWAELVIVLSGGFLQQLISAIQATELDLCYIYLSYTSHCGAVIWSKPLCLSVTVLPQAPVSCSTTVYAVSWSITLSIVNFEDKYSVTFHIVNKYWHFVD